MPNTALITGASSGIGRELARIHAARGGDLVIVARSTAKLDAVKAELEADHKVAVHVVTEDLAEEGAAERIFSGLDGKRIDVLVNNAGFGGRGLFHERDWNAATGDRAMIQVNVVALTALTRLVLPGMVERRAGRVLNVSSTASLMAGPLQAVYFATKAYVTSFSNALAGELHDSPVTVTALMPGATDTDFAKTSDMEKTSLFETAFSAADVARDGYDAMMKGELDVIAGVSAAQKLALKMVPVTPKSVLLKQVRQMQEVRD